MPAKYRADHIGSLLRPTGLLRARDDFFAGRISREELTSAEDEHILDALAMQREAGISVLSDGEFRREAFIDAWDRVLHPFRNPPSEASVPVALPGGSLRWKGPAAQVVGTEWRPREAYSPAIVRRISLDEAPRLADEEARFLKKHANAPYKVTMPGVGQVMMASVFQPGETDRVYASRDELVADLVQIMRREIVALIDDGVPYIQLDSLRYVIQIGDPSRRQAMIDAGLNPDAELDATIAADNASLKGIDRKGTVIGLHMCRGNNRSRWLSEGSYDSVAERAFGQLDVDRLLLEYDDERSGGFEALRYVPRGKTVVLGIISSKLAQLETVDSLQRRIEEAAKYVPLEDLAISPQCGFASSLEGNLLTQDEQKRKLELVVEAARRVWG